MRVIAGTCRGRRLAGFTGRHVRPTPDRVREALFSILHSKLGSFSGLAVLDLFTGSGALAIEALSRGAAAACLVDNSAEALRIARDNLTRCRLAEQARLIAGDSWQVIEGLPPAVFDLIFIDPPYGQGLAARALAEVDRQKLLSAEGILCAESGADEQLPETAGRLRRFDQRRYGSVMLNFYAVQERG